jgi:hypothetical protein
MAKTVNDHIEDIRAEREAKLERELHDEAIARVYADQEAERKAAVAAEVGLGPDAPPAEVARLHNLREAQFWSDFVNRNTMSADERFRKLAAEVGLDPATAERCDVWTAMRRLEHAATKRPIEQAAA